MARFFALAFIAFFATIALLDGQVKASEGEDARETATGKVKKNLENLILKFLVCTS